MAETTQGALMKEYDEAAEEYERSLPPEHYMEPTAQAQQRKITLESLDLVTARRPEVQVFNELLVQYRQGRPPTIKGVVPDNMVVVSSEPIEAKGHFSIALQPVGPLWALEYVCKSSKRKDYEDNFRRYERHLKVPYYLLFYPEQQELSLFRRGKTKYVSVKPNAQGRVALPELELEMALLDDWVRFWFRGQLLPLPAEMQRELDEARQRATTATRQAEAATRRAEEAEREVARLRALLAQPRPE